MVHQFCHFLGIIYNFTGANDNIFKFAAVWQFLLGILPSSEIINVYMAMQAGVGVDRALDKAQRASKKPRLLKSQAIIAEAHAMKPAMPYHLIKQKSSRKQPSRKSSTASNAPSAASSRGIYDIWDQPVQHTSNGQLHVADSLTLDRHDSGEPCALLQDLCALMQPLQSSCQTEFAMKFALVAEDQHQAALD